MSPVSLVPRERGFACSQLGTRGIAATRVHDVDPSSSSAYLCDVGAANTFLFLFRTPFPNNIIPS
jgi:hypothetical protein